MTKIALVTGAGSGIGRAAAIALSRDGFSLVLAGRRAGPLEETATLLAGESLAQLLDADGAALVIHAKPDDYKTDPSGDSGDRVACGVVTKS